MSFAEGQTISVCHGVCLIHRTQIGPLHMEVRRCQIPDQSTMNDQKKDLLASGWESYELQRGADPASLCVQVSAPSRLVGMPQTSRPSTVLDLVGFSDLVGPAWRFHLVSFSWFLYWLVPFAAHQSEPCFWELRTKALRGNRACSRSEPWICLFLAAVVHPSKTPTNSRLNAWIKWP